MTTLGRLEPVPLREAWEREDTGFTPWLAREENLAVLSEAVGIDLAVEQVEAPIGDFRADIVCPDVARGRVVLIENQLEPTDHGHLGQTITYAAGLEAVTVLWISSKVRDAHRAAIDWLNRITDDDFRFFGVEVQLWRIDDSPAAPRFSVVARPNDWSKVVRETAKGAGAMTEGQARYVRFWAQFTERAQARGVRYTAAPLLKDNWTSWGAGRSSATLAARFAASRRTITVFVTLLNSPERDAVFDHLNRHRQAIESEVGASLDWSAQGKERNIRLVREIPSADESHWSGVIDRLLDDLVAMESAFRPLLRSFGR